MLELPIIKTDFLFKNSQNFNQTTHARPQHPIPETLPKVGVLLACFLTDAQIANS